MFELLDTRTQSPVIKAIGVGGGGGNAISHMVRSTIEGVEFITANTDAQALNSCEAKTVLQIGADLTKGLGAGANPDVGRRAALEDRERIMEALAGAELVFVTAGMGGGTGTGAAPIIAQVAKEMGILTVAVVTKPFAFEGKKRMRIAEEGIAELSQYVDSLITIPNDRLLTVFGKDFAVVEAFKAANDVLLNATRGISDLITRPGLINVDFADVKTVMSNMGMAMMGTGKASGPARAREAAEAAIRSPLLDEVSLEGAKGILINVTAEESISIGEYNEVMSIITEYADEEDCTIVVGTSLEPKLGDEIFVTVVATGLGGSSLNFPSQPRVESPVRLVANGGAVAHAPGNYGDVETTPAYTRRGGVGKPVSFDGKDEKDQSYWDIPAFLRRQAD